MHTYRSEGGRKRESVRARQGIGKREEGGGEVGADGKGGEDREKQHWRKSQKNKPKP
jgi:hypothetical protein